MAERECYGCARGLPLRGRRHEDANEKPGYVYTYPCSRVLDTAEGDGRATDSKSDVEGSTPSRRAQCAGCGCDIEEPGTLLPVMCDACWSGARP